MGWHHLLRTLTAEVVHLSMKESQFCVVQALENSVLAALATLLKVLLVPVQLLAVIAKRATQ
jgi:hypothetical protein